MTIETLTNRWNVIQARKSVLEESLKTNRAAINEAQEAAKAATKARDTVLFLASRIQHAIQERIAGVVTAALESVFDDPYTFRIVFETKRNQTEGRLVFMRDGQEIDPMTGAGGGVMDVASFAIRVAALLLENGAVNPVLILDEPFKFVSAEYRERIGAFIERLSSEFDLQIIMVTHIEELKIGKVIAL